MMQHRDRRAVVVGAAVAFAALIGFRGVPWARRRAAASLDRLHARAELLARARADVASAKALEDSGTVIRHRMVALATRILAGSTLAEATADLSGHLAVAAQRHAVRLERTDGLPDSMARGALRRTSVRATLEGDTRGTFALLASLAADSVVVAVDRLRMVAPDPGSGDTVPEVVRSELTVHGWYLSRDGR